MKTKTAEIKTFGSLAICTQQTHNFAPPSRGGFAVSMFQQGRANIKQNVYKIKQFFTHLFMALQQGFYKVGEKGVENCLIL